MHTESLFPGMIDNGPIINLGLSYDGQNVRVMGTRTQPEWVAIDLYPILGLSENSRPLREFDEDEKGVRNAHTPGGNQSLATVTEPGLYRLIFQSRRPEAKAFKRWVFHDVLPCLRQHGTYPAPQESSTARLTKWAGAIEPARPVRDIGSSIDPVTSLIPLAEVPAINWLPIKPSVDTVYEWHRYGRRGVYLETLRLRGRLYTTEAAVFIFARRLAAPNPIADAPLTVTLNMSKDQIRSAICGCSDAIDSTH